MKNDRTKVKLCARARAEIRGACFSGDLFGKSHKFEVDGRAARVNLPKIQFQSRSIKPGVEWSPYISLSEHKTNRPSRKSSFYRLEFMLVEIEVDKRITIPQMLLKHHAVREMHAASAPESKELNSIAEEYQEIAVKAWRHWRQTARWATNNFSLGASEISVGGKEEGLELHRLYHRPTGCDVWALPTMITVSLPCKIDRSVWDHIQSTLSSGLTSPVWLQYLAEATIRCRELDYSGAILSCAIACETIARAVFEQTVGRPTNKAISALLDRTAAQAIIGKWDKLTGLERDGKIHKIFDLRNDLVHSGVHSLITKEDANSSLKTARRFVEDADEWLFAQRGEINPRLICQRLLFEVGNLALVSNCTWFPSQR